VVIVNKKEVLQGSLESATAQKEMMGTFLPEAFKNP
jgi:hypothetical protein